MRTTLLLRVASVTSLLFAAGHTLGGTQEWSPMGETDVLQAMRTHRFDVMGLSRTYLDFYRGFGYTLTVTLLLQAVLLWQLASLARTEPRRASPMIASFVLASLASTVIAWAIILPVPAYFAAFLTACLAAALLTSWRGR
ncbi:MAG TPA: hypothetical protein VN461_19275 [Vicinamibacteria bacterium]|jgi:hypothetical protein|nr:hypothetical protein [Vicinamibacteria bacterium]